MHIGTGPTGRLVLPQARVDLLAVAIVLLGLLGCAAIVQAATAMVAARAQTLGLAVLDALLVRLVNMMRMLRGKHVKAKVGNSVVQRVDSRGVVGVLLLADSLLRLSCLVMEWSKLGHARFC